MTKGLGKIERRLRISGALILLALAVEVITLHWSHPVAFLVFLAVGGISLAIAIPYYLLGLVSSDKTGSEDTNP